MAFLNLRVPEGQFCCDKQWIGCMHCDANQGVHTCTIFHETLEKVEISTKEENRQRVLYKCPQCLEATINEDTTKSIVPTTIVKGWKF